MGDTKDTNGLSLTHINPQIRTRGLKQRHNLVDNQGRIGLEVFVFLFCIPGTRTFNFLAGLVINQPSSKIIRAE